MFSQVKNKSIFAEKNARISHSTFVYLLMEYAAKEAGGNDEKVKQLGEQIGPRVYESLHYFQPGKWGSKRCLNVEDAAKFIAQPVWIFLTDKQADLSASQSEYTYYVIDNESGPGKDNTVIGNFFAGIVKGVLGYMGFECDSVIYKLSRDEKTKQESNQFIINFNAKCPIKESN